MHAVFSMVATTIESMSAFEHTDPAFTADAPAVVGRASFASHYARIGRDLGRAGVSRQYETTAAVEAGRYVTRELGETVASSKAGRPMTSRNHHADVP